MLYALMGSPVAHHRDSQHPELRHGALFAWALSSRHGGQCSAISGSASSWRARLALLAASNTPASGAFTRPARYSCFYLRFRSSSEHHPRLGPVGISHLRLRFCARVDLRFTFYPKYRLFVMWRRGCSSSSPGSPREDALRSDHARGIENKEMVSLLGIDVHRLFTALRAGGLPRGSRRADGADRRPVAGMAWTCSHRVRRGRARGWEPARAIPRPPDRVAQAIVAATDEASTVVIYAVMAAVLLVRPRLVGIR